MIEFFHLVKRVSSTELWWDLCGINRITGLFSMNLQETHLKVYRRRISFSSFPRRTLAFCKLSWSTDSNKPKFPQLSVEEVWNGRGPRKGMEAEQKRGKQIFWYLTQITKLARAGWPRRLGLVRAIPWVHFAVIGVQLFSTMTAIFPCAALIDKIAPSSRWSWISANPTRDLRFKFERNYFENLVLSHPNNDFCTKELFNLGLLPSPRGGPAATWRRSRRGACRENALPRPEPPVTRHLLSRHTGGRRSSWWRTLWFYVSFITP